MALSTPFTVPRYTVPTAPEASTSPSTTLHTHTQKFHQQSSLHVMAVSPGPVVARHVMVCAHLLTLLQHLLSHFAHQLVAQRIQGSCAVISSEAEGAPVL